VCVCFENECDQTIETLMNKLQARLYADTGDTADRGADEEAGQGIYLLAERAKRPTVGGKISKTRDPGSKSCSSEHGLAGKTCMFNGVARSRRRELGLDLQGNHERVGSMNSSAPCPEGPAERLLDWRNFLSRPVGGQLWAAGDVPA
jgi:hypothetical protein